MTAQALLAAFDDNHQIPPLSDSGALSLDDGYAIAARIADLRRTRGERIVGRKIGFTNRTLWPIYSVDAPIWGWVWESGLHDIPHTGEITLPARPELRLEPEIVFGLRATPDAGMDPDALWGCIDWVAHGVELVTSLYPGWRFTAGDSAAAQGMHASLWIGRRLPRDQVDRAALHSFGATLTGPDTQLHGQATDVLDGPLYALAHLICEIPRLPGATPLRPGEVVTTGTLTDAVPVFPGQRWETRLHGIAVPGLRLTLL